MPKPFPTEFRADVVRVARASDSPAAQIARDFGISESCFYDWMKQADVDDGVTAGVPSGVEAELQGHRIDPACELLGVTRQGFYKGDDHLTGII